MHSKLTQIFIALALSLAAGSAAHAAAKNQLANRPQLYW
jgi:Spy/CpxP family protein refolding chaperone